MPSILVNKFYIIVYILIYEIKLKRVWNAEIKEQYLNNINLRIINVESMKETIYDFFWKKI